MLQMELAGKAVDEAVAAGDLEKEKATVKTFNIARAEAEEERRNLMIHRQACGFLLDNHRMVMKLYPIPGVRQVGVPVTQDRVTEHFDNMITADMLSWRHKKMTEEERRTYLELPRAEKRQFLIGHSKSRSMMYTSQPALWQIC